MIYELRTYEAVPGKIKALENHLATAFRMFPKHGLPILGAWSDEFGRSARITYMWSAENEAARNAGMASFGSSAEWRAYAKDEQAREGQITARVLNRLLQPTPYSPTPALSGKVQELREYQALPGRLPNLHARFADHTLGFFAKHGVGVVGFWTEIYGTSNRLVYMTSFDSLAAREKRWGTFTADPDWLRVRAQTEAAGPIVEYIDNRLLRLLPTA